MRHLGAEGFAGGQALTRVAGLVETSGQSLPEVITRTGLMSEQDLARAYAGFTGLEHRVLTDLPEAGLFGADINIEFLRRCRVLPLRDEGGEIVLAVADPLNEAALRSMTMFAGKPVRALIAPLSQIDDAIEALYGSAAAGDTALEAPDAGSSSGDDVDRLRDLASGAPVIRMVNRIITAGVDAGATDIHIEPLQDRLRIRHRIDGVLRDAEAPALTQAAAIISRVKILSNLDIAERRLSQDGRLRMSVRGQNVDFRVSTIPAAHGESVALRILDQSQQVLDFGALGITGEPHARLQSLLKEPHGVILVTGPTGSGKTTTLYTSLMQLNSPTTKILTVEDPVEYMLDGINQVQVHPTIGLSFASALRSFLRQDPDILMVGEIRDQETAQVSIQAALTGHLVLSTLHTNDAVSALTRLLDMGVEDYLISSTVLGIVGQRLVRRLCPECREPYQAAKNMQDLLKSHGFETKESVTLYRPKGCSACDGLGYKGRTALAEVLTMSEELRALVVKRADADSLLQAAEKSGFKTMFAIGADKALAGETTLEEVLRVTKSAERH